MMQAVGKVRRIAYDGDQIEAIGGETPRDYQVVLKPTCDAMGLDYSAQRRRVERADWAVVAMMATTGADGKTFEMVTKPPTMCLMSRRRLISDHYFVDPNKMILGNRIDFY